MLKKKKKKYIGEPANKFFVKLKLHLDFRIFI